MLWWHVQAKRQRRAAAKSPELPMTAAEREAELRKREALRDQHKLIYRALYSAGEGASSSPCGLMLTFDPQCGISQSTACQLMTVFGRLSSTYMSRVCLSEVPVLEEVGSAGHMCSSTKPALSVPASAFCMRFV